MTSYELAQRLEELLQLLRESQFVQTLSTISSLTPPHARGGARWLGDAKGTQESKQNTDELELVGKLLNLRAKDVFGATVQFQQRLKEIEESIHLQVEVSPNSLIAQIEEFSDHYGMFLDTRGVAEAQQVVDSAVNLFGSIGSVAAFIVPVLNALEPDGVGDFDSQGISLLLASAMRFKDLVAKLRAIDLIYSELSALIRVSPVRPLEVRKIESGSLWIKLAGESHTVQALVSLIENAVIFLYRSYTAEGKVAAIPRKVEVVLDVLRLAESLEKAGVDTKALRENIEKSAIIISRELNHLLIGESSIKLNGIDLSITPSLREKYLSESRLLLIEDGKYDSEEKSNLTAASTPSADPE